MKFILEDSEEIVKIWSGVFETLSISQFEVLRSALGFPLQSSNDLWVVAKSFALSYLICLGRSVPEQPYIKLLESIDDDSLSVLWENTFSHLSEIGYGDVVYHWGKRTYPAYLHQNNQVIQPAHWDALLTDWANNPLHPGFVPLLLSSETSARLLSIVTQYRAKSDELRLQVEQIKQLPKNTWEQYAFEVLKVDAWIHNQSQFMMKVAQWTEIFEALSIEEIGLLEAWGCRQIAKIGFNNCPPLVQFNLDNKNR